METKIVKVTLPRIISDNPQATFTTRDGSWVETTPINMQTVRWLNGRHEAYFELIMDSTKIISMKPVPESTYYAETVADVIQE